MPDQCLLSMRGGAILWCNDIWPGPVTGKSSIHADFSIEPLISFGWHGNHHKQIEKFDFEFYLN